MLLFDMIQQHVKRSVHTVCNLSWLIFNFNIYYVTLSFTSAVIIAGVVVGMTPKISGHHTRMLECAVCFDMNFNATHVQPFDDRSWVLSSAISLSHITREAFRQSVCLIMRQKLFGHRNLFNGFLFFQSLYINGVLSSSQLNASAYTPNTPLLLGQHKNKILTACELDEVSWSSFSSPLSSSRCPILKNQLHLSQRCPCVLSKMCFFSFFPHSSQSTTSRRIVALELATKPIKPADWSWWLT